MLQFSLGLEMLASTIVHIPLAPPCSPHTESADRSKARVLTPAPDMTRPYPRTHLPDTQQSHQGGTSAAQQRHWFTQLVPLASNAALLVWPAMVGAQLGELQTMPLWSLDVPLVWHQLAPTQRTPDCTPPFSCLDSKAPASIYLRLLNDAHLSPEPHQESPSPLPTWGPLASSPLTPALLPEQPQLAPT